MIVPVAVGTVMMGETRPTTARGAGVEEVFGVQPLDLVRQAGCGRGTDSAALEETERSHWLKQAQHWLRADLAAWVRLLDRDPAVRGDVWKALTLWQVDPDLACVRDPGELGKLVEDDRKQYYLAIWAEVAAVLARIEK